MKALKLFLLCIPALCMQMAWPDEVTVTLQNGLQGYSGCEDVHIANQEAVASSEVKLPGANDGSCERLAIVEYVC